MKAGIVIITYNNEHHVEAAIDSILNQSFPEWEMVVVDNGSTDRTPEVTKARTSGRPEISVYIKENEGPSAGRNFGLSKLSPDVEYVQFLDGDDMLDDQFLEVMIAHLDKNPDVGLLGCQYDTIDEAGQYLGPGFRSRYRAGLFQFPTLIPDNILLTPFQSFFAATGQGAFALFRKSVLEKTTGYEHHFWSHEDSDIFCQMALIAQVHYLPRRLYKVRVRESSLSNSHRRDYGKFRDKWDFYDSDLQDVKSTIENSLKYYYTRHKPLRDFKVGLKSFIEGIKNFKKNDLNWSRECFGNGIHDLLFQKSYKRIIDTRRNKMRFTEEIRKDIRVGVVIITHNNEYHITDAIKSVRNQHFKNWTAVIVDNGSTDPTFNIIQQCVKDDDRFSAYKKTNEGPAAGRNLAFSKLPDNVDYIHFLDGDDILHENFLSRMIGYLETNQQVGLVACQFDELDFDGNYLGKGHRSRYAPSALGLPRDLPLKHHKTPFVSFFASTGQGPFAVYRKSVYMKTYGFELKSQEDTDMFCKMGLLAEVHYIPEYLYQKRRHSNNLAHSTNYRRTHHVFRQKWDLFKSDDPAINEIIEASLKYYYKRHKPLRDFKISIKAFKYFVRKRDWNSLKWSLQCARAGLQEIVFAKSYRAVLSKRLKEKL